MARILLVDDDGEMSKVLRGMLEVRAHTVEEGADGQAALAASLREPVDLVITDIRMPRRSGLSAIEDLKKHSPNVPAIALVEPGSGLLAEAPEAGAEHVFAKPFKVEELLEAVSEVSP